MEEINPFIQRNNLWGLLFLILPLIISFTGCEDTVNVTLPSEEIQGIRVTGSSSAFGEPDIAILRLGVSTERDSVEEASEEAAFAMQRVINSLKENDVGEKNIQTQQFSILPQYDYVEGRKILRGYRVTNIVSAEIRNLKKVGNVIDDAAKAGDDMVQIQSIQFDIDDRKKLQEQARVKAMKDAKAKAEILAEEGGVKLGKPIYISESIDSYVPNYSFDKRAEGATPIETGELEVRITVSVIYEIE